MAINSEFGIACAPFRTMPRAERQAAFLKLQSLGLKWLRVDIDWATLETSPGNWTWTIYDDLVTDASQYNLRLIFILCGPPPWERIIYTDSDPKQPARNFGGFASYCHRVVTRYTLRGVKTYEIVNEPNNRQEWTGVKYTDLLKACTPLMKLADPTITILAGASGHSNQLGFFEAMYTAGASPFFDAISHHPYTFPDAPPNGLWANLPSLRQLMIQNGDGPKKIWLTEYGAPTGGANGGQVTEEAQANMIQSAITTARNSVYISNVLFYTYKDFSPAEASTNPENYFGLWRQDGTEKPACGVIQAFCQ